jgi:hypothetical protein
MKALVLAIVTLLMSAATGGTEVDSSERVTLCRLVKDGIQMNGRQVRMTVIYSTDLLEHTSITDPRCPRSYAVSYDDPNHPEDPSLASFNRAVEGQYDDLSERKFLIDLTGIFMWRRSAIPHGAIIFRKIWSFKPVQRTKNDH